MATVTSKFQVTIPKTIARQFGIEPGQRLEWIPAGDGIRVIPEGRQTGALECEARLKLFDQATERYSERGSGSRKPPQDRGWTREDLYTRGRAD